MGKLFVTICLMALGLMSSNGYCASKLISNTLEAKGIASQSYANTAQIQAKREKLKNMSKTDMENYLRERLQHVVATPFFSENGMNGDSAISVQKSDLQIELEKEAKKSTFEKIYEKAMNNIIDTRKGLPKAKLYQKEQSEEELAEEKLRQEQIAKERYNWLKANNNVIEATLPPNNQKTLIPAQEHIPYFFSRIELSPDGLTYIRDKIVVVANNKLLKKSLVRAFPNKIMSREGKLQKLDLQLMEVTINGRPAEYKTVEYNNHIYFEPVSDADVKPGIYNYEFTYFIDNQIFRYGDFDEFFWDVTGGVWNLVIARTGVALVLPPKSEILGQDAVSGYPGHWNNEDIVIDKNGDNVLTFTVTKPQFVGQGMQVIVSIAKGSVSNIDLTKKMLLLINDYGDIIFAVIGFCAILISFILSWRYIRKHKRYKVINYHHEGTLLRYLCQGLIDKKSFGIFLLDLYRKNIIDIEENDENILLIKKTDNTSSLSKAGKKAVNNLFTGKEAVLNINNYSMLKVQRAMKCVDHGIRQQIKNITLKLNSAYLIFSVAMLIITEISIAAININSVNVFMTLAAISVAMVVNMWIICHTFQKKWHGYGLKLLALILTAGLYFIMCSVVSPITSIIIPLIIYIIMGYNKLYSRRNGLLRNSVHEAKEYKEFLTKKSKDINLGNDFRVNQAAIAACDLEDKYEKNETNKKFYKLDILQKLLQKI